MKAVVLQISGKQAAVLADDGCMHNIPNRNYHTGEKIEMTVAVRRNTILGWAAAAAAVLCIGTTGAWAAFTPYSYVSLDVNPSVEYTLNRFDRVLSVKGVNDDGSELLIELDNLGNKTIDKAIGETVELIRDKGYFDGELEGGVVISTSAKDMKKAAQLADHLRDEVEKKTNESDKAVHVEAIAVGRDRVDEAHELGITPGKLNLLEKLKEATGDTDMSYDQWLDKPVKEIMKAIKDQKSENGDLDDEDNGKPESKPDNENKPESKPDNTNKPDKDKPDNANKPESKPDNESKPQDKPNKPDKDKLDKDKPNNGKPDKSNK